MVITIRLYKRHDLDLLSLYRMEASDFSFVKAFKAALRGYAEGNPIQQDIPEGHIPAIVDLPSNVQLHFTLNPEKDMAIIKWLNTITVGRRNNIMKHVVRNSFPVIYVPFLKDSENTSVEASNGKALHNQTIKKNEVPHDTLKKILGSRQPQDTIPANEKPSPQTAPVDIFSEFGNMMKGV